MRLGVQQKTSGILSLLVIASVSIIGLAYVALGRLQSSPTRAPVVLKTKAKLAESLKSDLQDIGTVGDGILRDKNLSRRQKHVAAIKIRLHANQANRALASLGRLDAAEVSTNPDTAAVDKIRQDLLGGAVGILVIGIFASFAVARLITKPIIELHRGIEKITGGDLEYTHEINSGDEIQDLAEAFNLLIYNLRQEEQTAADLQRRLLPQQKLRTMGARVYARQAQAKLVGGDWYDYYRFEDELRLLIADASGKGMPGALLATVGMSAIRSEPKPTSSIEHILNKTNTTIANMFGGSDFITLFSAQLSLKNNCFSYTNCGHEPPLYYNARHKVWNFLPCASGLPLGISLDLFAPEREEITLSSGDKLILYTDGLPNVRDKKGRFLSMIDLIGWLNEHGQLAIELLTDDLLQKTLSFNHGPAADDVTLLGIEIT